MSEMTKPSKAKIIAYWFFTATAALTFLSGGFMDATLVPQVAEGMKHLGYPTHFAVYIGIWKLMGGLVIVLPGLALLKEWAYFGMVVNLLGASVAHAATGDGPDKYLVPAGLIIPVVISYL